MKKSKITKSNDPVKILRMISRNDEFERNGGGQWVAMNKVFKDKSKYDRKRNKKELKDDFNSFFFYTITNIILFHHFYYCVHNNFLYVTFC